MIFHITRRADWEAALRAGEYTAPSLRDEGFIHLSQRHQVAGAANAHYRGVPDLVLLSVDPERVGAPLRYELSDHPDERFPHLYGPLPLSAVVDVLPFPEGDDGFTFG